jgi:hypothetical protein
VQLGIPPTAHRGFESNVAPFVLRPSIAVSVANVTGSGAQPRSADVTVQFDPPVAPEQRVVLLLGQLRAAAGFTFTAPPRDADTTSITFAVSDVPAGIYLVRVQVDGAESVPIMNTDGDFDRPGITL